MTKAVQDGYYYAWTRNQLETIQQDYNITNKAMIRRMNDLDIQKNSDDQFQFQTQQKIKLITISRNSPKRNLFDRSIHYFTLSSMKSGSRIFKNFNFYEFVYKPFQKRQSFQPFFFQDARKFEMHENSMKHENSNVIRFIRFLILTPIRISMKMILILEDIQMIQNSFNILVSWFNWINAIKTPKNLQTQTITSNLNHQYSKKSANESIYFLMHTC